MGLHTSEAILLDVFDLHETDRIVTLLTRDAGKRRGVARNARRKYSRFAGQLQPLAKVRATWFEKEGRDLARISAVELLRPAQGLQGDLEGILLGSYLAEHMLEFAQENEAGDHLYRLLDSTLEALLAGADRSLAARYFEAWVLRLSGIFPPPHECPLCGGPFGAAGAALAAGEGSLVCRGCAGAGRGWPVGAAALDFLARIGRESLGKMGRKLPPPAVLEEVEELCGRVRRFFLQRELNSYRVMRQTLLEVAETP
jgi:DNA repair protein RecO (recombination protein O)